MTDRLVLRRFGPADLEDLAALHADPAVMRYIDDGKPVSREVVAARTLPGILAGFRITASIALILVVAAEMIGAEYGIGAFVLMAGNLMQTDTLLAGVLVLSLLGLAIGTVLSQLERRLLNWR